MFKCKAHGREIFSKYDLKADGGIAFPPVLHFVHSDGKTCAESDQTVREAAEAHRTLARLDRRRGVRW